MPGRLEEVRDYPRGSTLGEPWMRDSRPGAYRAGCDFAKETLGKGKGRKCLVIGSAIFEAFEIKEFGWDVTYLDIRDPDESAFKVVVGDAQNIPLPDKSFDAVSTTCVINHAGTGRYGDGVDLERGDEIMLNEIARVLKPGCRAALSFGPCVNYKSTIRLGTIHRAYTVGEVERLLGLTPFKVKEIRIWSDQNRKWIPEPVSSDPESPDYISVRVDI